jgi:hypothetical protein
MSVVDGVYEVCYQQGNFEVLEGKEVPKYFFCTTNPGLACDEILASSTKGWRLTN